MGTSAPDSNPKNLPRRTRIAHCDDAGGDRKTLSNALQAWAKTNRMNLLMSRCELPVYLKQVLYHPWLLALMVYLRAAQDNSINPNGPSTDAMWTLDPCVYIYICIYLYLSLSLPLKIGILGPSTPYLVTWTLDPHKLERSST